MELWANLASLCGCRLILLAFHVYNSLFGSNQVYSSLLIKLDHIIIFLDETNAQIDIWSGAIVVVVVLFVACDCFWVYSCLVAFP